VFHPAFFGREILNGFSAALLCQNLMCFKWLKNHFGISSDRGKCGMEVAATGPDDIARYGPTS
jgi:hypothetical protein